MKLILTRHGETIESRNFILHGHMPGKLSEKGIRQAASLAERIRNEKIDCIYSSDLARAVETAKEIAKLFPDIPLRLDRRLRETDYKGLTGTDKRVFDFDNWSPDVESRDSMQARIKELLKEVYQEHPNDTVLFVGHAGINRALITVIMEKPVEYMKDIHGHHYSSLSIFEIDMNGNSKVHELNCTRHLD